MATLPTGFHLRLRGDIGACTDAGSTEATTDGAAIQQWNDQSGSGYHVTQATAANRPVYQAPSAMTGDPRPGVRFEMVDTVAAANRPFMDLAAGMPVDRWNSTIFVVARTIYHNQGSQALIAPGAGGVHGTMYWDQPVNASGTEFGRVRTASAIRTFPNRAFIGAQKAVYGIRSSINGVRHYRNTETFDAATITSGTSAGGWLMKFTASNWHCTGTVYEVVIYPDDLSDADAAQAIEYLMEAHGIVETSGVIVVEGDSIAAGHSIGTSVVYTAKNRTLTNYLACANPGMEVYSTAVTSSAVATAVARVSNHVAPRYKPGALNIMCLNIGTNNTTTGLETAAETLDLVRAYCLTLKGLGFKVIIATQIARNDSEGTLRDEYNDLLRAQYTQFADALADPAADPILLNFGNTTYFNGDGIHLNETGTGVLATHFNAAISQVEAAYALAGGNLRGRGR